MKKIVTYFINSFKPWFIRISKYIGILTIFIGIAYVLTGINFFSELGITLTLVIILSLGFGINTWAENYALKARIKEIIDEYEGDNIKKVIKDKNLIDYSILNSIINRTEYKLQEDGFYDNIEADEFENKNEIHKKIEEYILYKRQTKG